MYLNYKKENKNKTTWFEKKVRAHDRNQKIKESEKIEETETTVKEKGSVSSISLYIADLSIT